MSISPRTLLGPLFALVVACPPLAQAEGRVEVTDLDSSAEPLAPPPATAAAPAATPAVRPGSVVGRKAAQKYMGQRGDEREATPAAKRSPAGSSEAHYLALHVGGFVSDNSYKWGGRDADSNVGKLNVGLTYRLGEWQNSMDLALRVDYQTFGLNEGSASKLSFLPVIQFPDASSKFPLYFGVGAGLGVFTKQLPGESPISIDYQLLLGARFFNIGGTRGGFFVETGLKNHFHAFSDGQYNGTFFAIGGVFTF